MKKIKYYLSVVWVGLTVIFISCSGDTENKANETANNVAKDVQPVDTLYEITAQEVERAAGVPFSIVDPFHGNRTNKIPLYKTDIKITLNKDGSVVGNRYRVQYGWSPEGFIMDSVVYNDDFKGKWIERERLTSVKQKVYQITLDKWGYEWYWPENSNRIYAKSGDNWEAMINNQTNDSYPVIKYNKK